MTVEVTVNTAEIVLRTVKLSKSILKQMPRLDWRDVERITNNQPKEIDRKAVGWIHGLVLGDEWKVFMLVKLSEGEYALVETLENTVKKMGLKQIYVS